MIVRVGIERVWVMFAVNGLNPLSTLYFPCAIDNTIALKAQIRPTCLNRAVEEDLDWI